MKKRLVFLMLVIGLLPASSMGQTHIFVDVPTGNTWSDTTDPAPSAEIVANEWDTIDEYGELTGSSVRSPETADYADAPQGAAFEVSITIPEAGEWFLWASYNFPYPDANTFFVLDPDNNYISASSGPSPDPAPFLNVRAGDFNKWFWGGAPANNNAVNESSMGASLGNLEAGEYTLGFFTNETFEGTSGGSGSGATADPRRNPHIELLYLSNGGAEDRPNDEMFLAMQPFSGLRIMNPPTYTSIGGPIDVSVTVRPEQGGGAVTVTENVPSDLRVDNVGATAGSASSDGNTITWEIPNLSAPATLTYTVFVNSGEIETFRFSGSISDGSVSQAISGQDSISLLSFFIFETFAFPTDEPNGNEGASITELDDPLGGGNQTLARGWVSPRWYAGSDGANDQLDLRIIDSGVVQSQPQEFNPGNFSLMISGAGGGDGLRRDIEPVSFGEFWVSFTFVDEGPAASHWAGLSFFDTEGEEQTFVGKPWNAEFAGLGQLPGGDSLADGVDFTEPHHYLVRYVLDPAPGQNDSAYLWIDPDRDDRLDTYDAGGDNNDEISNMATIRLNRGEGGGSSAWWDNIFISSVPALPPAGAGRVDLRINDPDNRPPTAWDVISIDQLGDAETGAPYGHDNGDNHYLIVSGFIYFQNADGSGNQLVGYGLPADHMSGLNGHLLGPFNNQEAELFGGEEPLRNSFKFEGNAEQSGPFTLDVVPPGNYQEIRAAMTVANGDGQLFVTFNYEDGTTDEGVVHADDWYNDPPNLDFNDVFQLVNGMNRLGGDGSFDGRFNPAVFENAEPCDPSKVLVSVTLELDTSVNSNPGYNLFSILAIPEQAPVSVQDWMMY